MKRYEPFFDATPLLSDADALRERMNRDGFLYIPRLADAGAVNALYRTIIELCQSAGWADAEGHAQGTPRLEGDADWWEVYDPLQKSENFHGLAHRPEILRVMDALTEEKSFPHPRNIARITFPGATHFTTPAHQDYPLIQGTPDTFTAWIPLCDCPEELGPLAMLAGSNHFGALPVHSASGPGGLTVQTDLSGCVWQGQAMNAGDALIFHSLTVHAARPNVSADTLRVSADYRYQGVSQPIVADSLEPHYGRLNWETIFAGWQEADLPYYWNRLPLKIVARDAAIMTPIPMIATEKAK